MAFPKSLLSRVLRRSHWAVMHEIAMQRLSKGCCGMEDLVGSEDQHVSGAAIQRCIDYGLIIREGDKVVITEKGLEVYIRDGKDPLIVGPLGYPSLGRDAGKID